MSRLTLAEVERIRRTPGRSLLLFITDRCPVGCGHCSVDSRPDSPTISDFELFESIVAGICAQPHVDTIGISGGEPFAERRGLSLAVDRLASAGKQIVLYTSGMWANRQVPEWTRSVIRRVSCIFLSTDAFHAAAIDDDRFIRAAQTISAEGMWLIVQVLDQPEMVDRAERLLEEAFGSARGSHVELSLIPPLPYGRGASMFGHGARQAGESFGRCGALTAPVVRYDGVVAACCNERVIMGLGPERLRRGCDSGARVVEAVAEFRDDQLLQVMGGIGAGPLTHHPRFGDLAGKGFSSICQLCWKIQRRALPLGDRSDRLLTAMTWIGQGAIE